MKSAIEAKDSLPHCRQTCCITNVYTPCRNVLGQSGFMQAEVETWNLSGKICYNSMAGPIKAPCYLGVVSQAQLCYGVLIWDLLVG